MSTYADPGAEARRQLQICNACRYCESFCAVFPAVHARRIFTDADVSMLADLCHNCRGCYYACQYTDPHEFAVNIPAVLAEQRNLNWRQHTWPAGFASLFQRSGVAIAFATVATLAAMIVAIAWLPGDNTGGFYGLLSHQAMIAMFVPAFVAPLLVIGISIRRYWRAIGGGSFRWQDLQRALAAAANMRHLSGGHGDGCNFEDEDRFSHARRWFHQATMYGFLLCFAATTVATLMHYVLDQPAPYAFWSLPKLLGVPGGIALCVGTAGLVTLKLKADPGLGAHDAWGGEMGFVVLLFLVSASGLALYWLGSTSLLAALLALHLGAVLGFFLLMPYSKMVHGFFRLAALMRNAANERKLLPFVPSTEP